MAMRGSDFRMSTVKNSLVAMAATFLLWWAVSLAFAAISGRSMRHSLVLGLDLVAISFSLLLLCTWFVGRRGRGRVLLDCGTHSSQRVLLSCAVLYFVFGLSAALGFGIFEGARISETGIFLLLAIVTAVFASSRLVLYERGIWHNLGLLPWGKIESYFWEDAETLVVTLKPNARFFFSRKGGYRVSGKHQPAVNHLLGQLVPVNRGQP